jgi:hypothetical protein
MYSQLAYTIAKQHQAELSAAADCARLVAGSGAGRSESQPATTLTRRRGRVASLFAQATPRARGSV